MFLYLRLFFSFLFAAALVAYPVHALAGAQVGMYSWAQSVAPAMLPFMAVMPYLTCNEARHIYRRLFGKAVEKLFRLPGGCAAAMVIGLIGGSPAGAIAVARVASSEKLTCGQAARLAGMCCGVSPVYALSVMGISMMESERIGWCFVLSQAISLFMVGILFRRAFEKDCEIVEGKNDNGQENPVMGAVLAILRVGGYMSVFSAGLYMAYEIIGEKVVLMSPFIDLPSGIGYIFARNGDCRTAAMALGFGGVCIGIQNLGVLSRLGVKPLYYFSQKIMCGCICWLVFLAFDLMGLACIMPVKQDNLDIFDVNMLFLAMVLVPVTLGFFRKRPKKLFS